VHIERFIREVGLAALAVGQAYHIDPKLLLAQAAFNTQWGKCVIANNYFSMKGKGAKVEHVEYKKGRPHKSYKEIQSFPSPLHCFIAFMEQIMNDPRFEIARYLFHSPTDFFLALQKGGCSSNPNFAIKCLAIYNTIPDNWLKIIFDAVKG